MDKGMVISGGYGDILCRQKSSCPLELGELLICEGPEGKILLKAFDLIYGSQLSQQHLELMSGMKLEENSDLELMEGHLRAYTLARLKGLVTINGASARLCKTLPPFLTTIRDVEADDLKFLTKPAHPLYVGNIRSGSKTLPLPVYLDGVKAISHHILIPATTGKGKSNLTSVMLWDATGQDWCGLLVLDPHDEYYGRTGHGLKDHPIRERVVYYSRNPVPGGRSLTINLGLLRPNHFHGVMEWSDPQRDCIHAAHREFGPQWIESLLTNQTVPGDFGEGTLAVVRRRLSLLLDIEVGETGIICGGVFQTGSGATTPYDIADCLENGRTVIVDTSSLDGNQELLIGSMLASEAFSRYKHHLSSGMLRDKPVIGILIEEAPRVLGKDILERGPNIFSTIAREGRKFKVGLIAITQLPSLIPRDILANMNTKIVLGVEMKPERVAIIESAAQDLSDDDRAIASLDTGEAIITSNFARFAIPVKAPLFSEHSRKDLQSVLPKAKMGFAGMKP